MRASLFSVVPVGDRWYVQSAITGRRSSTSFLSPLEAQGVAISCDRAWNDGARPARFRIVAVVLEPEDADDPDDPRSAVADCVDSLGNVYRTVYDAHDDDGLRVDAREINGLEVRPCLNVTAIENAITSEILEVSRRGIEP